MVSEGVTIKEGVLMNLDHCELAANLPRWHIERNNEHMTWLLLYWDGCASVAIPATLHSSYLNELLRNVANRIHGGC